MKLKRFLAGFVAMSIAATFATIGASAADIVATKNNSSSHMKTHLKGDLNFAEVNIVSPAGVKLSITLGDWKNIEQTGAISDDDYIRLSGFKVDGLKAHVGTTTSLAGFIETESNNWEYKAGVIIKVGNLGDLFSIEDIGFGFAAKQDADETVLTMGKKNKFTVECDVEVLKNVDIAGGTYEIDVDKSAKFADKVADSKQINMKGKLTGVAGTDKNNANVLFNDNFINTSGTGVVELGGGNIAMADAASSSASVGTGNVSVAFPGNAPNGRLTLEQQAIVKASTTATLNATLKEAISDDIAIYKATYKIGDGETKTLETKTAAKGATNISFEVPMNLIYDEAYGNINSVVFTVEKGSNAKDITKVELTVVDINATDDTDADDDDLDGDDDDDDITDDDADDDFDDDDFDDDDFDDDDTDDDDTDGDDTDGDTDNVGGDTDGDADGAGDVDGTDGPVKAGVAVAAIPALIAGAAALVARKRK